jgi:hypothetical protein
MLSGAESETESADTWILLVASGISVHHGFLPGRQPGLLSPVTAGLE